MHAAPVSCRSVKYLAEFPLFAFVCNAIGAPIHSLDIHFLPVIAAAATALGLSPIFWRAMRDLSLRALSSPHGSVLEQSLRCDPLVALLVAMGVGTSVAVAGMTNVNLNYSLLYVRQ